MPKAGEILNGQVIKILEKIALVKLPDGQVGAVHISQVSNTYVKAIGDFLKVGKVVKVKVLTVNEKDNKIALSMKAVEPREERKPSFDMMLTRYLKDSGETLKQLQRSVDSKRGGGKKESPAPKKK